MRRLLTPLILALSVLVPFLARAQETPQYNVSFTYDGEAFVPEKWSPSKTADGVVYTSPDGSLRLTVTVISYKDFPVYEIKPVLECTGDSPTGIVEGFRSLSFSRPFGKEGVLVRRTTGSMTAYSDFSRRDVRLVPRHECDRLHMSTSEGRSSAWMPYFGLDFSAMDGLEIAIGWTGTWSVDMACGKAFTLDAGIGSTTRFRMLPGERFIMPYTVVYERKGKTVDEGLAEFRRFIIAHKSPRDKDGKVLKPILPLTASGGNKTDANMLKILDAATSSFDIPFDTFWVDAGWYGAPGEVDQSTNCGPFWYTNAGFWHPNTVIHPDGNLKKISDAAHAKGMKFLLWFEPERATSKAPVVKEHPEWFLQDRNNPSEDRYLLNLGDDAAREWIFGEISRNIEESGVDIYRQDFNMNPLPAWQGNDSPDRQGVTEIKHIDGLYAFWDALHERFPGLQFENCASGGTRMDIEMMSRAHSYCRDDAQMWADCDNLTQNITLNSTSYIPFTGGETFTVPEFDDYAFMSRLGATTVFTPSDFKGMFLTREPSAEEIEWFGRMFAMADRMRSYYSGDFYRLTDDRPDGFCGYQLDSGEGGFFILFRREDCPVSEYHIKLSGIDPSAVYSVEESGSKARRMKGSSLASQILSLPEPRTFKLVFYRKK